MKTKEYEHTMNTQTTRWKEQAQRVLDVRPVLEQGGEPCVMIMEAAEAIQPGKALLLIAPFEPVPLYEVLHGRGFRHETALVAPNEWLVRFVREA
jgi:uncharacterized protein (DUF2249 family)